MDEEQANRLGETFLRLKYAYQNMNSIPMFEPQIRDERELELYRAEREYQAELSLVPEGERQAVVERLNDWLSSQQKVAT